METWNRTLSGKRIEVRLHLFSEGSGEGSEPDHVLMAVEDQTSIRSQDERLRLLSALPEANPDMVIIMDCEARILYLNPKARAWLVERNFSGDDAIFRLLPQEYRHNECGTCDRKSERQTNLEFEDRHYRLKIHPFPGQNRCMVTIADVTDLTHLTEDKKLFSEAMQSSSRPIMITDRAGTILHANKAFEDLYGYSIDEVRGQNPRVLNPGRAVYRDLGYSGQAYDELFAGMWKSILDPDTARWEGELVNRAKDGRLIWAHLTMSGVKCSQGLISHFIAMPVDVTEQRKNEQVVRLELYRTIASVAEMRDNETGHHMLRVGAYARILANAIGMNAKFASDIETFAPLHDIGKVGIADEILLARRKLTETEFAVMRSHAVLGHQILDGKPGLEMADEICWCHHERWDGTGYPCGLKAAAIPLSARITAIADVYDALRNQRPYKSAWTHEATLAEMVSASSTQFDPALIDALVNNEAAFEAVFSSPQYEDKPVEPGSAHGR
jgi:PAS domain S-box-containing protein